MKKKICLFTLVLLTVAILTGCKLFDKPSALLGTWQVTKIVEYYDNQEATSWDYPEEFSPGEFYQLYFQFAEDRFWEFGHHFNAEDSILYLECARPYKETGEGKYYYDLPGDRINCTYTISGNNVTITESTAGDEEGCFYLIEAKRVDDSIVADWIFSGI